MRVSRSRTGGSTTGGRKVRSRTRTAGSRKPIFNLSLLSEALDSRVVFSRASIGTRYNNCGIPETLAANVPRIDYDPASVTGYNLYPNSQWSGGGVNVAPTGWIAPSTGARQPNGTVGGVVGGDVIFRFTAAAQRPFIQTANAMLLAAGDVRVNSVFVHSIYSGQVALTNLVNWVAAGGQGNQVWMVDGVEQATPDTTNAIAGTRVSVRITVTTTGYLQPRTGPGAGGACTVDMDCSRPAVHAAYLPLAYYSTTATGPLGNGVARGLLIEEQRINLIHTSETSAWTANAPNDARPGSFFGTWNGTVLIKGSVTGDDPYKNAPAGTLPAAGTTLSGTLLLDLATGTGVYCAVSVLWFDADGVHLQRVQITIANGVSASSTSGANIVGGRWVVKKLYGTVWQVAITATFTKAATNPPRLYCSPGLNAGEKIVAGAAQLEVGPFETSYIPTTSAQVTRAYDNAHVLYSSMGYKNDVGTFYFEGYHAPVISVGRLGINAGNTLAERRSLSAGSTWTTATNSGGNYAALNGAATTAGAIGKAAMSYAGVTVGLASDNTAATTAPLLAPAASDRFRIGSFDGAAAWNAPIRAIKYWPRALSGAELRAATA